MADLDLPARIASEEAALPAARAGIQDQTIGAHRVGESRSSGLGWQASHRGSARGGSHGEAASRTARVLIVGRQPLTALLLRLVVENLGHCVRDVASGAEAIALVGSWNADVVVADGSLVDMSGAVMVARLRSRSHRKLRIVLTGSWPQAISGADAVFPWPFEADVVAREIDSLIGDESDALGGVECPVEDPPVAAQSQDGL